MESKKLIVKLEDFMSEENQKTYDLINQYVEFEQKIKNYEKKLKELKEQLKKFDFDEITFSNNEETLFLSIKQYEQCRTSLNEEKLAKLINNVTNSDVGEKLIEQSKEKKIVQCVKFQANKEMR